MAMLTTCRSKETTTTAIMNRVIAVGCRPCQRKLRPNRHRACHLGGRCLSRNRATQLTMRDCAGCGRLTDRVVKDTTIMICQSCTDTIKQFTGLQPFRMVKLPRKDRKPCPHCHSPIFLDDIMCVLCANQFVQKLHGLGALPDNHPILYRLFKRRLLESGNLHMQIWLIVESDWHYIMFDDIIDSSQIKQSSRERNLFDPLDNL